mmetsp:Transcript_11284/g.27597  ORF Transcript_11284/g.27597 Transcript_11284/m.27597 type:complete len:511 (-) Transcript_11284:1424-2956(-)|eukprot:g11310.t1
MTVTKMAARPCTLEGSRRFYFSTFLFRLLALTVASVLIQGPALIYCRAEAAPAGQQVGEESEKPWKQQAEELLHNVHKFQLDRKSCQELMRAAEFTQGNFGSAWTSPELINIYAACVEEMRLGKLDGEKDHKAVLAGGVHFPVLLTGGHVSPPVSGSFQDRCWVPGMEDPKTCCDPGPSSGCFDHVFTFELCCEGKITKDVPHYFLAPALDMNVGNAVRHWGTFDLAQSYAMQSLLSDNDIVLDVGANVGGFTVPLAEKVGVGGKVFAFEPFRVLFQTLTANVALNGLQNVYTFQHALGAPPPPEDTTARTSSSKQPRRVLLHQPDLGKLSVPSAMRVDEQYEGEEAKAQHVVYGPQKELVDVRTLDEAVADCRDRGLIPPLSSGRKVAFVKIDVEFMEVDVVRGAEELLLKDRPRVWVENESFFDEPSNRTFVELMQNKYHYVCKPVTHLELLCRPEEKPGLSPEFGTLMREVNRVTSPHDVGWAFSLGKDFTRPGQANEKEEQEQGGG